MNAKQSYMAMKDAKVPAIRIAAAKMVIVEMVTQKLMMKTLVIASINLNK